MIKLCILVQFLSAAAKPRRNGCIYFVVCSRILTIFSTTLWLRHYKQSKLIKYASILKESFNGKHQVDVPQEYSSNWKKKMDLKALRGFVLSIIICCQFFFLEWFWCNILTQTYIWMCRNKGNTKSRMGFDSVNSCSGSIKFCVSPFRCASISGRILTKCGNCKCNVHVQSR